MPAPRGTAPSTEGDQVRLAEPVHGPWAFAVALRVRLGGRHSGCHVLLVR